MMDITIRHAQPTDAEAAVPLLIEANGDITKRITGETDWGKVELALFELFQRDDNLHSYLYTYVAELDGKVAGIMGIYPGDYEAEFNQNLSKWLAKKGAKNLEIDAEAAPGELYINTICINPEFRNKGIGTQLFAYAEEIAKQTGFTKLSLNVEIQKEPAIRLYKRLGYEIVSPWTIIGEPFYHMVKIV